ncbi:MAG: ribonuclease G [Burkholderiaceae bacterium]|jgi:ribonuclease G|nr:ribonuclease G [Burkholderiaceae bacterium]
MQQDILINYSPQETRVAVVENGAAQEVHLERTLERGRVGNIYLGKVARVLPGMQSAFIDIGLERAAFLHVADLWQPPSPEGETPPANRNGVPPRPIEKQVFDGQTLMVQVIKDPIGAKGARLSTQISIAGRMLVFLPQDDHIGVSQKIPLLQRDALRQRVRALASAAAGDGKTGGYILRTNAEDAGDAELTEDIAYLRKTWTRIREAAARQPPASLLHQDLNLLQRVLRDMVGEHTNAIRIDSTEQFHALMAFGRDYMPAAAARLQHYKGERPIFDLYSVDEEIAKALGRRVELKSGGYLIIDQTEALATIDVNTGGFVGARNFDDTVFKTNLEAAQAIARQLRLRNLGGIVIIDFIDMMLPEHQQAVLAELHKQLARDRVKTHVGAFSSLGLVEMTRKRTRESLAQRLCEPCEQCQGAGRVRTARTVAYDILREILREARQFNPREFRIVAAPAVIDTLLDEESAHLASLSDMIGKPISLQPESGIGPDRYDIVLL